MLADVIDFKTGKNLNIKMVKAKCSFCLVDYDDFRGLQSSTGYNICNSCSQKAAKLIKDQPCSTEKDLA